MTEETKTTDETPPAREAEGELERKALQLCNLAGTMMLACKQLLSLQRSHALNRAVALEYPCECETCGIPLPDLSDKAIEKLVNESNAQAAALDALREWREAVREIEAAGLAMQEATANTYPELWGREHTAVTDAADKLATLRDAADALSALSLRRPVGGEG